ncbi:response regulator [Zobellia galactanivorans]|uniref:Two-component system-Response regulator n=1 Tax=Zobellia galactanivorans (strain DSM 12802 / CCUG 47099 / CIP 106680 / NCIMB 13871 / Dsij) TaxID=63186 RepID=G0L8S3_ZOBGA|nr:MULTISPECIES: response regulator [Zobellia]MBU3024314.1 response regulator [Zobellia galactanivorans]MDO6807421.1 response regulator [Zobellia galactanivorans]OWW24131.1 DNA-binding response regulator [Zobellia sp. OII3]CAZ97804.1 Two-component system-Response regulator [Zobellia galactanivorans]
MEREVRILIVEDDMIIAANISLQLGNLGYEVTGIVTRGEEAILHVRENPPDILLLDINLKGSLNGIETAKAIQTFKDIPVIFLTANTDEATFASAKKTRPKAFITKPFNKLNLQRTVELVADQIWVQEHPVRHSFLDLEVLGDRIFIRYNGKMEKVLLDDILYMEADRNYCTVVTENGNFVLSCTLKTMQERLPNSSFMRVHRSYVVNLSKLDVIADDHLEINRKAIPLSKANRDFLFKRIQAI